MAPAWSGMRIIALPLTTRATSSSRASNALPLTYYHFQTPSSKVHDKGKPSVVKRVTGKAAETWASFGKAPEGNWKRKIFVYGEKLVDRIDFEELSLKGIDPSLGPRIGQLLHRDAEKDNSLIQIPLFYPPSCAFGPDSPLRHMQSLLSNRTPHHRKGFYMWLGIAPLTAPFALLPIIPNLPFFYAAWRAWSHYRAWKASQYLEGLINSNHIVATPSLELDKVYTTYEPKTPSHIPPPDKKFGLAADSEKSTPDPTTHSSPGPQPRLLLSRDTVPRILEIFELSGSAGADILRAIEQARVRIGKDAGH